MDQEAVFSGMELATWVNKSSRYSILFSQMQSMQYFKLIFPKEIKDYDE